MKPSSKKCGNPTSKNTMDEFLSISTAAYRFIGRRQIRQLASVFQEKPEVVEIAYIRALERGERLPPLLVGCSGTEVYNG